MEAEEGQYSPLPTVIKDVSGGFFTLCLSLGAKYKQGPEGTRRGKQITFIIVLIAGHLGTGGLLFSVPWTYCPKAHLRPNL